MGKESVREGGDLYRVAWCGDSTESQGNWKRSGGIWLDSIRIREKSSCFQREVGDNTIVAGPGD
jgi:hypothetical protein